MTSRRLPMRRATHSREIAVTSTVGPGQFSAKAVGEAGISIVAPAIANAVCDATGVRITQLPITPEKLTKFFFNL